MKIISPSLLSCDFLNIERELDILDKTSNIWLHLDIMDGHFVPNLTFGHSIIQKIASYSKHPADAHLMVSNPRFYIETLKNSSIHNLTFHYESCNNHLELIKLAKKYYSSIGISIKPNTNINSLNSDILNNIDLLLIMSVEPGFGGQKFIESSIDKIKYFSDLKSNNNYNYMIQVDGGINEQNASTLFDSGANNLVAGSFIFREKNKNYNNQINKLLTE